jgi:hypothetical protein
LSLRRRATRRKRSESLAYGSESRPRTPAGRRSPSPPGTAASASATKSGKSLGKKRSAMAPPGRLRRRFEACEEEEGGGSRPVTVRRPSVAFVFSVSPFPIACRVLGVIKSVCGVADSLDAAGAGVVAHACRALGATRVGARR